MKHFKFVQLRRCGSSSKLFLCSTVCCHALLRYCHIISISHLNTYTSSFDSFFHQSTGNLVEETFPFLIVLWMNKLSFPHFLKAMKIPLFLFQMPSKAESMLFRRHFDFNPQDFTAIEKFDITGQYCRICIYYTILTGVKPLLNQQSKNKKF